MLNKTLVELDFSWNSLGRSSEVIEILCKYLASDSQLQHMDISNNNISYASSIKIGESLKSNHNLLGLHVEGNYCGIDHMGFIVPSTVIAIAPALKCSARILRTPKRVNNTNCWLCNNYTDAKINWTLQNINWKKSIVNSAVYSIEEKIAPLYLHMSIDDYMPFMLVYEKNDELFVTRAVPLGQSVNFFFSFKGVPVVSNQHDILTFEEPLTVKIPYGNDQIQEICTYIVNTITPKEKILTCKPRPTLHDYIFEFEIKKKFEWSIENSIFSSIQSDTDVKAT